jgi:polyisoprenyl-teichoic acid--peptidoglycan teichoic acid transferase
VQANRAAARYQTEGRRRRVRWFIVLGGLILLVGGAYWAYSMTIKPVVESLDDITDTPVPVRINEEGTPVPVVFPDWDQKEPVNILLIGLDFRPQEEDSRADTQMVVHIDPANKTAALFSVPRDLWVDIPGYGEGRVNSAYQHGDSDKDVVPGGGPGLAMATIEHNFGIPIHYYAQVNFTGFEQLIDAMGGLTIDVPRPLIDNEYPLPNYGVTRIYIPAGLQHMDGRTALRYARSRHADSDLGRNYRQQQVLLAIREQALDLNLVSRLPELARKIPDAVRTDLSILQVGSLAQLGREIGADSIQTVLLEPPCVNQTVLASGADVLLPDWECIRPKVAQAFADPRLAKESAHLGVLNGTTTGGIARKVSDLLSAKGFNVTHLASATNQGEYPRTVITDYSGGTKPRTLEALTKALGVPLSAVQKGNGEDAPIGNLDGEPVDILVVAGDDRIQ